MTNISFLYATNRHWNSHKRKYSQHFSSHVSYGQVTVHLATKSINVNWFGANGFSQFVQTSAPFQHKLVFIHGFNNTFKEAALTLGRFIATVQHITSAQNLCFILFSWPSKGKDTYHSYKVDEEKMQCSIPCLSHFLNSLAAPSTHVLAHSLGARFLWKTLKFVQGRLGKIFWMASDIRKNKFKDHYHTRVHSKCVSSTNYFCKGDKALELSWINSGCHKRVGQSSTKVHHNSHTNIKVSKHLAQSQDRRLHTYLSAAPVVNDILEQIFTSKTPQQRHLKQRSSNKGWALK